jgi:Ca2+-binding RTX toxin-like protein
MATQSPNVGREPVRKPFAVTLSLAAAMAAVSTGITAHAGGRMCFGEEVTILRGPNNNHVEGTPDDDVIFTGDGNDVVFGRGGNDRICLGNGSDDSFGGKGADSITGGRGNDFRAKGEKGGGLNGGVGNDRLFGRKGADSEFGWKGRDRLYGGANDDFLDGVDEVEGNDILDGGRHREGDGCIGDDNDKRLDCEFEPS